MRSKKKAFCAGPANETATTSPSRTSHGKKCFESAFFPFFRASHRQRVRFCASNESLSRRGGAKSSTGERKNRPTECRMKMMTKTEIDSIKRAKRHSNAPLRRRASHVPTACFFACKRSTDKGVTHAAKRETKKRVLTEKMTRRWEMKGKATTVLLDELGTDVVRGARKFVSRQAFLFSVSSHTFLSLSLSLFPARAVHPSLLIIVFVSLSLPPWLFSSVFRKKQKSKVQKNQKSCSVFF